MAWTAPRTWVTGETVTAAIMNAHVRDNLLETAAATATTAGDLVYADAANSMGSRVGIGAAGTHLVSTGSAPVWRGISGMRGDASYTGDGPGITAYGAFNAAQWNIGTDVTITVTTGTIALVWWGCRFASNNVAGGQIDLSYAISGATTSAATAGRSARGESSAANDQFCLAGVQHQTGLTAGSNTFTLNGLASTATATVGYPYIGVMAL